MSTVSKKGKLTAAARQEFAESLMQSFEVMMRQLNVLGRHLPESTSALTFQQFKILFALHHAGTPLAMSELSSRIGVTPGTLTEVVKKLVRAGYVDRNRSPEDDRIVRLSINKEGREIISAVRKHKLDFFMDLCNELDAEACQALIESHRVILKTYQQYQQILQKKQEHASIPGNVRE